MRSYPIICPSCNGTGWIASTVYYTYNTQDICPACNGNKYVMCTDTN